ncbi:MAG: hypothetical protein PVF33_05465 [Candidatus Latescibacterota bacterium]|jgi:hypothetical protein
MRLSRKNVILSAVLCFAGAVSATAQVAVSVSGAVDTTDVEIKAVLDLWVDYVNSQPGQMWNDLNWDGEKSRLWLDFDLTAPFVYRNGDAGEMSVSVLAIEREGELYSVRTLFQTEGPDTSGPGWIPWAAVRVFAQKVDGQWKLRNALDVLTSAWHRPAIGRITFVFPPAHDFDILQARRAVSFCDSISDRFPFFRWDPFYFFITKRREDVDRIIGLDYYAAGFPSARTMRKYDIMITGEGSEWCPRELAEMAASGPGLAPHPIVLRGFAGWVGGWGGRSYRENMIRIAAGAPGEFEDYVERGANARDEDEQCFPGAVVCDMVFAAAGVSGIEALFKAGAEPEDLYRAIQSATGLDRSGFRQAWRRYIEQFAE